MIREEFIRIGIKNNDEIKCRNNTNIKKYNMNVLFSCFFRARFPFRSLFQDGCYTVNSKKKPPFQVAGMRNKK
jgi:hypothetical protein